MEEKKTKGIKNHIITDIEGRLLVVEIHAANIHDTKMGYKVFEKALEKYPSLKGFCADMGYRGTTANYVTSVLNKTVEIAKRITKGWTIHIKNYVVERTFAWFNNFRRLAKVFEKTIKSLKAFIYIAHAKTLLKRNYS